MKTCISLILLIFMSVSCSRTSVYKTSYEYWDETNFSWEWAFKELNDENCYESGMNYFGCSEAVNVLLSFTDNSWFMFAGQEPFKGSLKPDFIKSKMKGVYFVKDFKDKKDEVATYLAKNYKNANRGMRGNWTKHLNDISSRVPFQSLINEILIHLRKIGRLTPNKERYFAAIAYNSYLRVKVDPRAYLRPREATYDSENSDTSIVGIGISQRRDKDGLHIVRVIKNGPAYKAGVFAGDIIKAVKKDEDSDFFSFVNLRRMPDEKFIQGKEATIVTLKLERDKKEIILKIPRGKVVFSDMEFVKHAYNGKSYLQLIIHRFYWQYFCSDFREILEKNKPYNGIIIDLRSNGGGATSSAYCLSDHFLKDDSVIVRREILETDFREPTRFTKIDNIKSRRSVDTTTPLVVLLGRWSASSSEISTAALQDAGRALVFGERSFGKGYAQWGKREFSEISYLDEYSDLFFFHTKSFNRRPRGTYIQGDGIRPNVYLARKPDKYKKIERLPFWERKIKDFPGYYIPEYDQVPKWEFTKDELAVNEKLTKCRNKNKKKIAKLYAQKSKLKGSRLPDYQLMHTLELFQCL